MVTVAKLLPHYPSSSTPQDDAFKGEKSFPALQKKLRILSACGCYVHASDYETRFLYHVMEMGTYSIWISIPILSQCQYKLFLHFDFPSFLSRLPSSYATNWIFSTMKNIIKNIQKNMIVFRFCLKALERQKASQTNGSALKQVYSEDKWRR